MFSYIWSTVFFNPIYNLLVYFISVVRDGDLGLAVIATVLVVKICLLPLSIKAAKTQKVMREIEPKLKAVKEQYKDDKEALVKAQMAIYKEAGMNPLAVLLNIFIQFPFLIALYVSIYSNYEVIDGVTSFTLDPAPLYSFVTFPETFSTLFLGSINMLERSIPLALLAGITAYFQVRLTMPVLPAPATDAELSFKDEFMRNMQTQMRVLMPIMMVGIGYFFSSVIALYLIVSNIAAVAQELYIRRLR
jgi:YidC/Oxa1 family membrane protein insertase